MNTNLVRSVVSLVAILGVGTGVSYALFTSNTVTIAASNVTTGSAELNICNITDADPEWLDSVDGLDLEGIVPGQEFVLTENAIFLGNDGGALNQTTCEDNALGSSDAILDIVPTLTGASCGGGLTNADLQLKFGFGSTESNFANLDAWAANNGSLDTNLAINADTPVKITALLNSNATAQDATCTFGVNFKGNQS